MYTVSCSKIQKGRKKEPCPALSGRPHMQGMGRDQGFLKDLEGKVQEAVEEK